MNITILLIGSNPIPNYVALSYLMKKERDDTDIAATPDEVWMMYSKDTKVFADAIVRETKIEEKMLQRIDLGNEQRNGNEIMKRFGNKIAQKAGAGIEQINLVYTGGTKPMSVFSVSLLKEEILALNFAKDLILTDVDPVHDRLNITRNRAQTYLPKNNETLSSKIRLPILKIIQLHQADSKINAASKKGVIPDEIAQKVFMIFTDNERRNQLRSNEYFKKVKYLKNAASKNEFPKNYQALQKQFPDIPKLEYFKKPLDAQKYLMGGWLEEYAFTILQKIMKNSDNYDLKKNVYINQNNGRQTEIDVLLTIGHKLYLFSCGSTMDPKEIKSKAFEALYRAEQIGGEHAKAIVISVGDKNNIKEVESDFKQFNAMQNLELLGITDIQDAEKLANKFNQIIGR
jgi:hypothetical protein